MAKEYFLLITESDLEPFLHGPYSSEERDTRAKGHRQEHGVEDGVFALDIEWDTQKIDIYAYSGGFMEDGDMPEVPA